MLLYLFINKWYYSVKKYVEELQSQQFRGIKIIYQYDIDGKKITNKDETMLHDQLGLSYLENQRKQHLLKLMYTVMSRRPDLLIVRERERVLQSDKCIHFEEK